MVVDSNGFGYAQGLVCMVELPQAQLGQNMAYGKPLIYERHAFQGALHCGMKSHTIDNDSNFLAVLQPHNQTITHSQAPDYAVKFPVLGLVA
jgi:hypothetical protein